MTDHVVVHLRETFDQACRAFPDIMEPYAIAAADLNADELKRHMRRALAETIRARYPLKHQRQAAE